VGRLEVPILVGVLPLLNHRHAAFLHNEVPGINIPQKIQEQISASSEDSNQAGVRIAVNLVEQMRSWASGIYLMPAMNRYDLAVQVLDQLD
jgi:homocysteine S-methyltransferase